ncbi:PDZ domain-containing protein [candidate division KSB1 bacterium]|nr:PDZ domain-containing protein [candidate division KSB1 bacterium]
MMRRLLIVTGVLLCAFAALAVAQPNRAATPDALMLRFPDVSADRIVFVYAGDLWTAPKEGGMARQLSSPKGLELFPKFSPDGKLIAFSGNYDGNTDVYLMSAEGGTPTRLTHHPDGDLVVEWYPDGKHVLYRSQMMSPSNRFNRLFKQPLAGGMPETLPLAYGELASFSPDGKRMAFQLASLEFRTWKRYRGGWATDLWFYDFANNTSEKFTDFEGTDALPMWQQNKIYFLSDRDERKKLNIWAYDLTTKQTKQVTNFTEYDVKWPSLGPDAIVFENGGKLYLLDLASETAKPISIQVPADLPEARAQAKDASKNIQSFSLSPSGKRALFEARGEIFTVPEKHGSVRNLTNTSGIAERFPAWSPDGKIVAYFSDRSGEYELYVRAGDGSGKERQIATLGAGFRYSPAWSPDSKRLAFNDKTGSLFVLNIADGKPKFVDKDEWSRITSYSWSPDSRWLAYSKSMPNNQGAIMIYDADQNKAQQVTGDYYNDTNPAFDPEGKYLFFYSDRKFTPVYGDMDATWVYPNATEVYAVTLRKDVESPLAPRSDEEKGEEKKDEEDGKTAGEKKDAKAETKAEKKEEEKKAPEPVNIDFDGIETRVVKLPVEAGNVGPLCAVKGKVVFARYPASGAAKPGEPSGTLVYYDLKEREDKTVISGIDTYDLSADGKKVIYKSKTTYGIVDLAEGKKVGDGKIAADKMQAWINPREEWEQIFTEAWRIERDFFYDPDLHGLDWTAIKQRYARMLPYVVDRADLNYVIGEMIAELNASHAYVGGGDVETPKQISVGLLGCDFELDKTNNAYRIKKIYEGAVWDAEVRSPLRQPGVQVNEGDYLLAVNGQPLDTSRDPWAAFQGLASEVVKLTINSSPNMTGAREVVVEPMDSEFRLRNLAWIESNRRKVEEATGGRVGYIYVPNTGRDGQSELVRQFTPQRTKAGLIIDERFNSGGQIPDRFIELLNRPIYNYWARRDQRDWQTPFVAHTGPKVMLVNGWAGSGGDAFPYYFRKTGLGPLVGKRTWGGLIGISGNPQPIDGGFVSAPTFGFWNTEGQWDVEGRGVDPDYDIENAPHEMAAGRDPQLEKAIEVILDTLKKAPPPEPQKPVYPNRSDKTDKTD